jgi:hypothetical protein
VLQAVGPSVAQLARLESLELHGCPSLHGRLDLSLSTALTRALLDSPSGLVVTGLSSSCNVYIMGVLEPTVDDSEASNTREHDPEPARSDGGSSSSSSSWETYSGSQYPSSSAEAPTSASPADLDDGSSWGSWETYDGLDYLGDSDGSRSCAVSDGGDLDTSPVEPNTGENPAVPSAAPTSPADLETTVSAEENHN